METYQAMTLVGSRALALQERQRSELQPHEVWVRVHMAGICGTDLAIYQGHYEVPLPLVLGHEFCGVVESIGSDVQKHWLERRVVAEINQGCKVTGAQELCPECKRGLPGHCRKRTVLGIDRADGAFARYVRVPVANLHPLPDGVSDRVATFVEPMAAALQTFVMCPLQLEARVLVVGTGRLGLLVVAAAKSKGAEVIAVSRSEESRRFASLFGADHVFENRAGLADEVRGVWGEELADVVVEVTGNPDGLPLALSLVRPRGTLCLKTTVGQPALLDATFAIVHELRISSSRCGPFAEAIRFLEQHDLPLDEWIRNVYPLTELEEALQEANYPGKVLLDVGLSSEAKEKNSSTNTLL